MKRIGYLVNLEIRYTRLEFTKHQVSYSNNDKLSLENSCSLFGQNNIDHSVMFGKSILLSVGGIC